MPPFFIFLDPKYIAPSYGWKSIAVENLHNFLREVLNERLDFEVMNQYNFN